MMRIATPLLAVLSMLTLAQPCFAAVKRGTPHRDVLAGTARDDRLLGRGGADRLRGKAGDDRLRGGRGPDRLFGGRGRDRLFGGPGRDLLMARDGEVDVVHCGGGRADLAIVDRGDRVSRSCERVKGPPRRQAIAPGSKPAPPAPAPTPISEDETPSATPDSEPEPEPEPQPEPEPEVDLGPPPREELPLAMFPAEHGWAGNGIGEYTDVGPPFVINGDRSFKIETNGAGEESVATSPPLVPLDLTGSHVVFHAQVSFSDRLEVVKLRLASGDIATDYAEATVWLDSEDSIILGSTFERQSIPLGAFDVTGEVDWSAIDRAQIALTDNATGTTSLYVAGIYATPTYRQAIVSFAFDDGFESVYTEGLKALSAHRLPATAYAIADIVGDPGRLDFEQLETLRDQHDWEIAGHSFSLESHNQPNGFDSLSHPELEAELDALGGWLDENGFSRRTLAYPKGAAGTHVRTEVAERFCAGRATAQGPETLPSRDDYTLRGWSANGSPEGIAEIEAAIDEAVAGHTWLMLSFHDIVGGERDESGDVTVADFAAIVEHVDDLRQDGLLKVRTVGAALAGDC